MNAWLENRIQKVIPAAEKFAAEHHTEVEQAGGDVYFALWIAAVDILLGRIIGVGHRDMPDLDWRSWYDADLSPKQAHLDALDRWREDGDLPGIDYAASL